jgi:hypothetical protein
MAVVFNLASRYMGVMIDPITDKIAAKRSELVDLERRLAEIERNAAILRAEIAAYEDAKRLVGAGVHANRNVRDRRRATAPPTGPGGSRRQRAISAPWRSVLQKMAAVGHRPLDLDEIGRLATESGLDVTRSNVRSQMAQYTKREIVERVRAGRFRLTSKGQQIIGLVVNPPDPGRTMPSVFD